MGGKRETKQDFGEALRGKTNTFAGVEPEMAQSFSEGGKTKSVVKLEKKENEYLCRQGRLNQDIKELKSLKEKLLKNIMANMDEIGEVEKESKKLKEDRRLISDINEKLRRAMTELEELPLELETVNEALMIETMKYCYEKMRINSTEIEAIKKWIEDTKEEVKKKAVRRQVVEDQNREIYSYMHDIFGANIIEIFDLRYEKEPSQEE